MRASRVVSVLTVGALCLVIFTPLPARAQQLGTIAGTVKDTSGAVLPGVTVEASSPVLIEKVRTATTDDHGEYKILDLFPGAYSVTFALTGFGSEKREGVELIAGFTATINGELKVGALNETITVSAASPVVDVQNVTQARVMTRDALDAIPSGKQFTALASLVPGVTISGSNGALTQDVGGMSGMAFALATIHGGHQDDQAVQINGMSVASLTSIGNSRTNIADGNVEEYNMQLASQAAEFAYGGVYVNVIPKEGSNAFHGAFFGSGTSTALQKNNLDATLLQDGLKFPNQVKQIADVNPGFGGALIQNKLWFYTAYRYINTQGYVGGLYYNATPTSWIYTPNTSQKAVNDQNGKNESLNLTFQASPKNKFTFFYDNELQCYCHFGINANLSPEAALYMQSNNHTAQATWSSPVTNKLLVDAAFGWYWNDLPRNVEPDSTEPGITDLSNGLTYRGAGQVRNPQVIDYVRGSVSYVTGAHAFKFGGMYEVAYGTDQTYRTNGNLTYSVLNGPTPGTVIPQSVTYYTTPYPNHYDLMPAAAFAQDQWTAHHFTVTGGLRFDVFRSSYGASNVPATQYLPVARAYPGANVLDWKDLSPRLGFSYDVFGNGKTAFKASVNRYVQQEGKTETTAVDPVLAATNSITRAWENPPTLNASTPANFTIAGNPLIPAANGQLGPSPNNQFGLPTSTLFYDPKWSNGFGVRPYDWEFSAGVQHELLPNVSVGASYFRRIFGNFIATYNADTPASDYSPYCITAPSDSRLASSGNQVCGLYNLNSNALGLVDDVRTNASNFGVQKEHWDGVDLSLNARLPKGILVQGGLSTGKFMTDNCPILQNDPQVGDQLFASSSVAGVLPTSAYTSSASGEPAQFCHQVSPFITQVKFLASYPLPWGGLRISGTFQSIVPDPTQAQEFSSMGMPAYYVATNAQIAPSLGRNLSNATSQTIEVEPPGSLYLTRANQIDLRLTKVFKVGRVSIQPQVDCFNVFNSNPVFQFNSAYGTTGSSWLVPQSIMPGRLFRLGGQIHF